MAEAGRAGELVRAPAVDGRAGKPAGWPDEGLPYGNCWAERKADRVLLMLPVDAPPAAVDAARPEEVGGAAAGAPAA